MSEQFETLKSSYPTSSSLSAAQWRCESSCRLVDRTGRLERAVCRECWCSQRSGFGFGELWRGAR